jgi:hypothetical protein
MNERQLIVIGSESIKCSECRNVVEKKLLKDVVTGEEISIIKFCTNCGSALTGTPQKKYF